VSGDRFGEIEGVIGMGGYRLRIISQTSIVGLEQLLCEKSEIRERPGNDRSSKLLIV
jgi:hypothetical protein